MQLFTHLLSSYLQGMGDFFSALPWGGPGRGFRRAGEGPPFTKKTGEPTVKVGIPG